MNTMVNRVSLFLPCLADMFVPRIGFDTIKILKRAGIKVDYPKGQTCCGQPAFNQGFHGAAREMARHFIRTFDWSSAVVCPSGSCVLMVREHYPELFEDEPVWRKRAENLGARTFELTDFLVNEIEVIDLDSNFSGRVTVHDSCHPLRGLGLTKEPRILLNQVEGLELVEMMNPDRCCGFGGAFMARFGKLSSVLAHKKIEFALASGADTMVITEPGCLINLNSALEPLETNLKAVHITEVLAGK